MTWFLCFSKNAVKNPQIKMTARTPASPAKRRSFLPNCVRSAATILVNIQSGAPKNDKRRTAAPLWLPKPPCRLKAQLAERRRRPRRRHLSRRLRISQTRRENRIPEDMACKHPYIQAPLYTSSTAAFAQNIGIHTSRYTFSATPFAPKTTLKTSLSKARRRKSSAASF